MEAANQKKKLFFCKYCNKRYPCGKSLGGHIRTHMNNGNSAEGEGEGEAKFNIDKIFSGRNINKDSSFEAGGQSGYGLRENPKRTTRFVDSNTLTLQQEMVCKECGKGFQSHKALCGHMACHSEKHLEGGDLKQKLVMNGESETETETLAPSSKLRRSKGTGCMTAGAYFSFVDVGNGSSSVSEIEQEQEEVAMCLMMLSRDSSGCKKGLNSFADSSVFSGVKFSLLVRNKGFGSRFRRSLLAWFSLFQCLLIFIIKVTVDNRNWATHAVLDSGPS